MVETAVGLGLNPTASREASDKFCFKEPPVPRPMPSAVKYYNNDL